MKIQQQLKLCFLYSACRRNRETREEETKGKGEEGKRNEGRGKNGESGIRLEGSSRNWIEAQLEEDSIYHLEGQQGTCLLLCTKTSTLELGTVMAKLSNGLNCLRRGHLNIKTEKCQSRWKIQKLWVAAVKQRVIDRQKHNFISFTQ